MSGFPLAECWLVLSSILLQSDSIRPDVCDHFRFGPMYRQYGRSPPWIRRTNDQLSSRSIKDVVNAQVELFLPLLIFVLLSSVSDRSIAHMALLFAPRHHDPKTRAVPNGGLGGFVCPEGGSAGSCEMGKAANSSSKKAKLRHRPPPIRIVGGHASSSISPAQPSAVSSLGIGSLWTPKTPTDRHRICSLPGGEWDVGPSPVTPRHNSAVPSELYCSPPETPISAKPCHKSLPVELPGSLLLPSQGFPQTNPISPPPSLRLHRRDTEDSTLSSVPTLVTSSSSDDDTMDTLRNLTTPLRKHDRLGDGTMPNTYTIGSRVPMNTQVTRPFSAMTIEDLLDRLLECDRLTVSQQWLPAMRIQFQKMVSLLNDAGQVKLESSINQIALTNVRKTLSDIHGWLADRCNRI